MYTRDAWHFLHSVFYFWLCCIEQIGVLHKAIYILCIYIIYYWGEPERAPHRRCGWVQIVCMYVCMYINIVRTSVTLYGSMDISAKYSIAHSRAWATGRSNLSNCKFILYVRSISLRSLDWSRTAPYWPVEGTTCLSPALNKGKLRQQSFQVTNNEGQPRLRMQESGTPRVNQ